MVNCRFMHATIRDYLWREMTSGGSRCRTVLGNRVCESFIGMLSFPFHHVTRCMQNISLMLQNAVLVQISRMSLDFSWIWPTSVMYFVAFVLSIYVEEGGALNLMVGNWSEAWLLWCRVYYGLSHGAVRYGVLWVNNSCDHTIGLSLMEPYVRCCSILEWRILVCSILFESMIGMSTSLLYLLSIP